MPQDLLFWLDEIEDASSTTMLVIPKEGSLTISLSEAPNFVPTLGLPFTALAVALLQALFNLPCRREKEKNHFRREKRPILHIPNCKKQKEKRKIENLCIGGMIWD